jgi:peroxiredoxin
MFVEPNHSYHIKVPPKKNLDIEDELNPFFTRIDIIPGIEESDSLELNYLINTFNEEYENYIARFFNKIYFTARKSVPDSVIAAFERKYQYSNNLFFKTYLKYKLNMLRYMAYERDDNYVIKYRFNNEPVSFVNPAYMELFNDLFKHYLSISVAKQWGTKIMDDISKSKSPAELRETLKNNPAFSNDTLIELVILKGLHDAFYAEKISGYRTFPGKQLYMTLDSMICCSKISLFRNIAENIKQKVLKLAPGTIAPSFYLLNQDSVRIGLSDLKGKYLLINFYDFRSYTFLSEMTLLGNIANKFQNNLDIVTIVKGTGSSELNEFTQKNNFKWQFLIAENTNRLYNDYSVKAFPTYYLIDPYGKIVLSPSPGPDGNFDPIFAKILTERN